MKKVDKIDKYEVIEELGTGGMSRVYKCYDSELERFVAIKELRAELKEKPDILERFLREAKIIARLDHPNIVKVYEYLDLKKPQGRFFVMEYVDGVTLSTLMDKTKILPLNVACYIALKVAEGLSYAHKEGIIHRDIKPSNIVISRKGDVKIMDFGISRSLTLADSLTSPGIFIGTPAYASPEQLMGAAVDQRTDIFAFGAVFYEMLTGKVPFESDSSRTGRGRWKYKNVRKFNKEVPRFINRLIRNCLRYDPAKRYDNMDMPAKILSKYLEKSGPEKSLVEILNKAGLGDRDKTVTLQVSPAEKKEAGVPLWRLFQFLFAVIVFVVLFVKYHYSQDRSLFRGPSGVLRISIKPWGNVYINKNFEARVSATYHEISLPVGKYTIRIENPYCEPVMWNVEIKKDITYEKEFELNRCRE